jgi:hypothetical protein
MLRTFNINTSPEEYASLLARYDPNNDGVIDYYEFVDKLMPPEFESKKQVSTGRAASPLRIKEHQGTTSVEAEECPSSRFLVKVKSHVQMLFFDVAQFPLSLDVSRRDLGYSEDSHNPEIRIFQISMHPRVAVPDLGSLLRVFRGVHVRKAHFGVRAVGS